MPKASQLNRIRKMVNYKLENEREEGVFFHLVLSLRFHTSIPNTTDPQRPYGDLSLLGDAVRNFLGPIKRDCT